MRTIDELIDALVSNAVTSGNEELANECELLKERLFIFGRIAGCTSDIDVVNVLKVESKFAFELQMVGNELVPNYAMIDRSIPILREQVWECKIADIQHHNKENLKDIRKKERRK